MAAYDCPPFRTDASPPYLSDAHQSVIHYDFVQRVVVQDSSEYDSVRQPLNGALYGDEQGNLSTVTDPEIRRLEDRINSVDREGQLRLEKAMAEVNGTMKVILERTDGMKSSIDALGSLKTTIIVTAVASVIAMAGCVLAGESLWGSGFSSGQSDRQSAASAPPQHYK